MEESIKSEVEKGENGAFSFREKIEAAFSCETGDLRQYSPLTLAYIGDDVYDTIVRTVVVERANRSAKDLHRASILYVKAGTQAAMADAIEPDLTPEEEGVYHRGRNAKSATKAKNATVGDYRKATGFEALVGYLYLAGRMDRLLELITLALDRIGLTL